MGEITAQSVQSCDSTQQLMVADVAVDDSQNPTTVRKTNTTQFSGVDVHMARTDDDLCPASALLAYLMVRRMTPFVCRTVNFSTNSSLLIR